MDITSIENKINKLRNQKPRSGSKFHYEVNEVYVLIDKKIDFKILASIYKRNPTVFYKAKNAIYGMIKDGMILQNKGTYFMWYVKYYGKNGDSKSK
jgi:hypothetical protein